MQAFAGLNGDNKEEEKGGEPGHTQQEEGATAFDHKMLDVADPVLLDRENNQESSFLFWVYFGYMERQGMMQLYRV